MVVEGSSGIRKLGPNWRVVCFKEDHPPRPFAALTVKRAAATRERVTWAVWRNSLGRLGLVGEGIWGRVFETGHSMLAATPEEMDALSRELAPENARLFSLALEPPCTLPPRNPATREERPCKDALRVRLSAWPGKTSISCRLC